MTIETVRVPAGVETAALALAAWFCLAAGIMAVAEPTRDAVVIGPPRETLAALAGSDTRIVEAGTGYLIVRGTQAGFVRALYAGGAWLVLPHRTGGCRGGAARVS
jgi:hypothetical protein